MILHTRKINLSVGSGSEDFNRVKEILSSIPLWPSHAGQDNNVNQLLSANRALIVEGELRDSGLVPWMLNYDRFVQDEECRDCLQRLGVKQLSLEDLIRGYGILNLPDMRVEPNWKSYEAMMVIVYRCWNRQTFQDSFINLLRRNIAIDNDLRPREAHELIDHEDDIFAAAFRKNRHGKFIHRALRQYHSLWMTLGMRHNPSGILYQPSYLECLQELKERLEVHDVTDIQLDTDTSIVLAPLITPSSGTRDFTENQWRIVASYAVFKAQTDMSSQPVHRQGIMATLANAQPILTLYSIISYEYSAICWSQVSFPIHHPTKEVLSRFENGQPSTFTVWQHLLHLKEMAANLHEAEIQDFLNDLQETYKFLQDNFENSDVPPEAGTQAVWLNVDSFDANMAGLANVKLEWRTARKLVLSSSFDSGSVKAVKGGLMRFDKLLRAMGCKLMSYPTVEPSMIHEDSSTSSTSSGFREMRDEGALLDIAYQSEGRVIKAHKQLLASISKKCRAHFSGRWTVEDTIRYEKYDKDGNENEDFLSFHTLSTMINHAYKERVDWTEMQITETDDEDTMDRKLDMLLDLHKGADCWDIPVLMSKVEATILNAARQLIRIDNVEDVMERASEVNARKVEQYCMKYIEGNKDVADEADFEDAEG